MKKKINIGKQIRFVSVNHIHNLFIENSSDKSSLTFLPWLPLSASDRHILSVTASRLQSRSLSLVSKSCEFLRDVLFKDFPAEIFLHRPSVLQVTVKSLTMKMCNMSCLAWDMPMTLCLQELWACFKMPTCHWPKAYQISAMAISKHLFITAHNCNNYYKHIWYFDL